MKKYVVPEGMMNAACNDHHAIGVNQRDVAKILEAAIRWLAENPIVPTDNQFSTLYREAMRVNDGRVTLRCVIGWQRRMFLAPEPEVPEDLKDLLICTLNAKSGESYSVPVDLDVVNKRILEAYRRGQQSKQNQQGMRALNLKDLSAESFSEAVPHE